MRVRVSYLLVLAALVFPAYAQDSQKDAARLAAEAMRQLRVAEESMIDEVKARAYQRGKELAERAVELDSQNADAHFALFAHTGRLLERSGFIPNPLNLLTLRRSLKKTLELDPNHPDGLTARGTMSRRLPRILGRDLAASRRDLERAVEVAPSLVVARIELAKTYAELGEAQLALAMLESARQAAADRPREPQIREIEFLTASLADPPLQP